MIKTKKTTRKKVKNTDKSINPKETIDNYFPIIIEKCNSKPTTEKKSTQKPPTKKQDESATPVKQKCNSKPTTEKKLTQKAPTKKKDESATPVKQKCNSKPTTENKSTRKPPTKKKDESATPVKQTLMDYFPVRHSNRENPSTLLKKKTKDIEDAILSQREDGLKVETFPEKGRGVRATKHFRRGDFVVEYSGELVDSQEAKLREEKYAINENGCYMYYFKLNNKNYCVDATAETKRLGRLINHSRHGNLSTKSILIKNVPCLIMIAAKDIKPGEELLFDYGDRSKRSLVDHPWLAK